MTATPETTTAPGSQQSVGHFLISMAHSVDWARKLTKEGRLDEAAEHVDTVERLIAAYRIAVGAPSQGLSGELVVQTPSTIGFGPEWRDWSKPIPALFMDHARRQLQEARTARPDLVFRLARRVVFEHVSNVDGDQ